MSGVRVRDLGYEWRGGGREPHEPQTDPGMGSPGPDVDGPGGDGGVPLPLVVVVVVAAPNAIPTGPGLSAERHSGDTIKKVGTFVGTFSIAIIQS